ncbi:DNA polymerase III subunit gamma/tau [Variovorax sp. Root318D1]|uniref:DNA polymerase III subunit gamma/tau n=1 Tax=Variovorax sp. Root318D1 TaxID=1736513 RepID=UPI0006F34DD8|nr:DNA polymerase III subunit gamma/tau [Variovorax sp. Root318D1]KQU87793.1 DNA polymerase III subunit gamma/tau [Variovorax sp. Root318D1]
MSYLVLARKFRPKTFGEMVGQGHVVQALENALTTQRLHHAYLFTGTRGVGKTTVSRILAKSLNCQGPDGQGGITATPCGVCQACKDIDSGRFVDYTELDAASNRGVDEVQSLLEQAVYKPVQGRFKVFMIDEVHMLTNTAFNAMLKTLEEPPEYLKFVLATTDPQKVPVTVLSRCLQFNLRPMAPETVLEHLTSVLQTEQVPAEPQALRLLARAARGSMRDALSLTDQAIAFGNGELLETGVRQMLGSVDRGHVFKLIEALAEGDGKTVVDTSEALRRDGMSAASTLEEMTAVLQAMAVLQAVPSRAESADSATDPDAADTARLAALMPADETQLLYSLCLHGRGELGLAPDEYAALTMVLLRLLAFKPSNAASSSASTEKKTLNEARKTVSAPAAVAPARTAEVAEPPVPAAAPVARQTPSAPAGQRLAVVSEPVRQSDARPPATAEAPPWETGAKVLAVPMRVQPPPSQRDVPRPDEQRSPAPPIPPSEDGDFWHATVTQMIAAESINALARELALQSQLVARDVDQWILRVERELLNQPSAREKLSDALAALGHSVKLAIEIGGVVDSPARRNKQAADERQRVAEDAIRNDPEVQMLMREFDAKIVPGTLKPA